MSILKKVVDGEVKLDDVLFQQDGEIPIGLPDPLVKGRYFRVKSDGTYHIQAHHKKGGLGVITKRTLKAGDVVDLSQWDDCLGVVGPTALSFTDHSCVRVTGYEVWYASGDLIEFFTGEEP